MRRNSCVSWILLLFTAVVNAQLQFSTNCGPGKPLQYIFVDDKINFDTAELRCPQLNPSAELARIPDQASFNLARTLIQQNVNGKQPWIGIRRVNDNQLPIGASVNDPSNFFQNANDFGNVNNGQFPWRSGSPNGTPGQNSACV